MPAQRHLELQKSQIVLSRDMGGLASALALAISLLRHSQVEKLSKKRKVSAKACRVSQVYAELPPIGPPISSLSTERLLRYGKIFRVRRSFVRLAVRGSLEYDDRSSMKALMLALVNDEGTSNPKKSGSSSKRTRLRDDRVVIFQRHNSPRRRATLDTKRLLVHEQTRDGLGVGSATTEVEDVTSA